MIFLILRGYKYFSCYIHRLEKKETDAAVLISNLFLWAECVDIF